MTEMVAPDLIANSAEEILVWLEREPDDDLPADLAALGAHFAAFSSMEDAGKRERLLPLFRNRVLDLCGRFVPWLMNTSLPLTQEMHTAAADLVAALLGVAAEFQRAIEGAQDRRGRTPHTGPGEVGADALLLVSRAFLVISMAGAAAPPELWRLAHVLVGRGKLFSSGEKAEPGLRQQAFQYKRLLSMAVAQPESLTARELVWLFDYLENFAAGAGLGAECPPSGMAVFWIDISGSAPPVANVRRPMEAGGDILYFSPSQLAQRAEEQIEWLENRILEAEVTGHERDGELLLPEVSGLPEGLTPVEVLSLLRCVRERWVEPVVRIQPRSDHEYTVQVCAGLRAIWEMGKQGEKSVRIAEWTVRNESSNGYAIMCVDGVATGLSVGMALAVRRDAGQPWLVCIVRWIRSEQPDQVELGLQVVAGSFAPVQICFRGGEARTVRPALVLPPMAGVRNGRAILAAAGSNVSRRFAMVHEGARLYVAQARVLGLDIQTAAVELFRYEIDPYPI